MLASTSHSIKHREHAKDVFYTPESLVRIHLEEVKTVFSKGIILDSFKGKGAYYKLYNEYFPESTFEWCEITDNKDFFTYTEKVDAIITNPPYSIIDKVLQKSVDLQPQVISYLIGIGNLTAKRVEFMNSKGYELCLLHITKVFEWYGMSAIATFRKCDGICHNVVMFDRKVHR